MNLSALHISCHANVDRRIISEMNYLVTSGWEVTFLHTPLALRDSGIMPEVKSLSWAEGQPRSATGKISFKRRLLSVVYRILTHNPFCGVPLFRLAVRCRNRNMLKKLEEARRAYDGNPAVIHVHDVWLLEYAAGLRKYFYPQAKLVYDAHELTPFQTALQIETAAMLDIERRGIREYDAVISVNHSIAERMAEIYDIPEPYVLYNSVSQEYISDKISREEFLRHWQWQEDWPEENRIILFQGTLAPERNLENLVRAFALLPKHLHLFMLGDGLLKATLENIIAEKNLAGQVHLAGSVNQLELISFTGAADIGIVPYLALGCENNRLATPNKLYEYIAAGLPVCGSNLPELINIFNTHHNGRAYVMNSAKDIAAAIMDICRTIFIRKEITAADLQKTKAFFSYRKQGEILTKIYHDLLVR